MDERDTVIIEETDRSVVEVQEDDAVRSVVVDSETVSVVTALEQGPPGAGADKHYQQAFQPTAFLSVVHNLSKYPSVTVVDTAGDEVEGAVSYISNNELTVSFGAPFGGVIYLN